MDENPARRRKVSKKLLELELRNSLFRLANADPPMLKACVDEFFWTKDMRMSLRAFASRLQRWTESEDVEEEDGVEEDEVEDEDADEEKHRNVARRRRKCGKNSTCLIETKFGKPVCADMGAQHDTKKPSSPKPVLSAKEMRRVKAVIHRANNMTGIRTFSPSSARAVFQLYDESLTGYVTVRQFFDAIRQPEFVQASIFTSDEESLAIFKRFCTRHGFAWLHFLEAITVNDPYYTTKLGTPYPDREVAEQDICAVDERHGTRLETNGNARVHRFVDKDRIAIGRIIARAQEMVRKGRLSLSMAKGVIREGGGRFMSLNKFLLLLQEDVFDRACLVANNDELQVLIKFLHTYNGIDCYKLMDLLAGEISVGKASPHRKKLPAGKKTAWMY